MTRIILNPNLECRRTLIINVKIIIPNFNLQRILKRISNILKKYSKHTYSTVIRVQYWTKEWGLEKMTL